MSDRLKGNRGNHTQADKVSPLLQAAFKIPETPRKQAVNTAPVQKGDVDLSRRNLFRATAGAAGWSLLGGLTSAGIVQGLDMVTGGEKRERNSLIEKFNISEEGAEVIVQRDRLKFMLTWTSAVSLMHFAPQVNNLVKEYKLD